MFFRTPGIRISNNHAPCFNRIDYVVIFSYIENFLDKILILILEIRLSVTPVILLVKLEVAKIS